MKILHLTIILVSVIIFSGIRLVIAEDEKPPIIITQVELSDPFKLLPDEASCEDLDTGQGCIIDKTLNHKVACGHYLGSVYCEPIHVVNNLTNSCVIASGFRANGTTIPEVNSKYGEQWITLYNTLDKPVTVSHFDIFPYKNWQSEYSGPTMPYHIANPPDIAPYLIMKPYQSCTYGFLAIDEPLSINAENTTLTAVYQYNGTQYQSSTPPLTDIYNDTRTWQFDGNKWVFAEQNTMPIPEFPFAVPVLLVSIVLLIAFYRFKSISFLSNL
jgi:hypothetical protein